MGEQTPVAAFDHRSVLRGTMLLTIGNVVGQAISFLGLLVLSRIYDPANVGLWAMFLGFGFMVPFVAGLRYDLAVVIVDDDRDAANLTLLSVITSVLSAVTLAIATQILFAFHLKWITPNWQHISLAYLPYIISYGCFNAATGWSIRKKKFSWLMFTRIGMPLATFAIQYATHGLYIFGNGLILGTVIGAGAAAIWSIKLLYEPVRAALIGTENIWRNLWYLARREYKFPLFSVPYALVVSFSNQAIVVLMGMFYSLAVVGLFNMAYRALYAPLVLIGNALSQAIMPSLSAIRDNIRAVEPQINALIRILGWIYLPPLIFIIAYGQQVFSFVFGVKWADAGIYAGLLTMAVFGASTTLWFERIFDILGRQKLHLALSIALNTLCLAIYVLAYFIFDTPQAVARAWSGGMLLYATIWITVAYTICGFNRRNLARLGIELLTITLVLRASVPLALSAPAWQEQIAGIACIFTVYGIAAYFSLRGAITRLLTNHTLA